MRPRFVLPGALILIVALGLACFQPPATPIPSPPPPATATMAAPTPTTGPEPQRKRINFQPGSTTAVEQGNIAASGMAEYVVAAQAGQTMSVKVTSPQDQVILVIYGADGTVLLTDHVGVASWSGPLPSTQDYNIDLKSHASTPVNYTLEVTLSTQPGPSPQPTTRRIRFAPGATTAIEQGSLAAGGMDRYVLAATAGQIMSVNVSSSQGQVILVIYGADGTVLISDHAGTTHWSGQLPSTQDYYIDARSVGSVAVEYTLQVTIPPGPGPQPTPKRIHFAPGSITAVEHGSVAAGESDRYVLKAMTGQTMSVKVSSSQGQVILVIWGADGTVLISDHAGATDWSGQLPSTQDYYISVQSVGSATANYTLEVTIPPRS